MLKIMLCKETGMLGKPLILTTAILLSFSTAEAQKKRVAVMNFDYAAVTTSVTQLFGTNQDVGKGIADLLVDKLVSDSVYSVIERKQLDKIIAEQNLSNSDRADPASAAKIARILGVDAIIIGSITQFGRDDKKTNVGAGVGALERRSAKPADDRETIAADQRVGDRTGAFRTIEIG